MAAYTTIDYPEAYFQVVVWTGTGSSNAITLGGDTDMSPDLVIAKTRAVAHSHGTTDSVRGAQIEFYTNGTDAEKSVTEGLKSFDSDGFTVGTDGGWNSDGDAKVAWCWLESATAGFDIVLYTGNGTVDTEISHSLSAVPHLMLVKKRSGTAGWIVYHHKNKSDPETDYLALHNTAATADDATVWSDEAPTSSVFTLGTNGDGNADSGTYVAYLWTGKQGFSKFGTYEGNGNADGTFVNTGFRPALVITKSIDSTSSYHMFDNKREGYNVDNDALIAEAPDAEVTTDMIDLLSNGFKFRIATDPNVAETYVYMAWAEAPFVNSNGVPCNAR